MARDVVQSSAASNMLLDEGDHAFERGAARDGGLHGAKEAAVHIGQDVGIVICGAAEHHAIDMAQVLVARIEARRCRR